MNIFASLPAGDSATWLDDPISLPDGRSADATGWTLKYYLRGPSSLDLTALVSSKSWSTTLAATSSATLTPGSYAWTAIITSGSERITVGTGQFTITPDLTQQVGIYDPRSDAQKALASCEAAMSTFNATGGKVRKYQIAGREMEFQSIGDLMTLHSFWKAKVHREQTSNSIAQGLGNPRNLYVRFRSGD